MSDELKPCPFCGSDNAPHVTDCIETMVCHNIVECEDETLFLVTCSVLRGGCGAEVGYVRNKADAIAAWNTRAERTCRMNHVLLYDKKAMDGIECDECFYIEVHSLDDPLPDRCPNCGAKVVG